ncbi:MAG TPA: DUF5013 domain-containing protein, partial [Chitinophagaceae bacterium]|nr:DUF5013 domain-containing protein [Chitinophagaceae bacterium]
MKRSFRNVFFSLTCLVVLSMISCEKIANMPQGTANIYFTAALDNPYLVPSVTKNYIADKEAKKLRIPLYISRSGRQDQKSFSVDVTVDESAAEKLIADGKVDNTKAIVAPADVYSIPASATGGKDSSAFEVVFDAGKLNAYLGKLLVLSVRLGNPSKYKLNDKLAVLNIVLDVDGVMLGAKTDVTSYIKNSGHPFAASSIYAADPRRGVLADWMESSSVKNFYGGKYGGWDNYGNGGFMSMDRYGSPEVLNGKIYQTIKLPAGKYVLTATFLDFGIVDQAYITTALGDSLPDISDIDKTLTYTPFTSPSLEFLVPTEQNVSIGILANLIQD